MKVSTLNHKRGDTFLFYGRCVDTDITDWTISSMIRDSAGVLIAECNATITDAAEGRYTLLVDDTTDWPVDYLRWDIEFVDAGGVKQSTETVNLRIREDITRPEA